MPQKNASLKRCKLKILYLQAEVSIRISKILIFSYKKINNKEIHITSKKLFLYKLISNCLYIMTDESIVVYNLIIK